MRLRIALFVLPLAVGAGMADLASAQGRGNSTRFAGMDKNNDGVIARSEWRGSDRSFEVHDWNRDGVLSGDEVRPGARRPGRAADDNEFEREDQEYEFDDWTVRGFTALDHNKDNRVTRDEWHFNLESFRRADHNNDGAITRAEFLGEGNAPQDDDREDRFQYLDQNNDGRVSRSEWHGTPERFDALDDDRNGALTRAEMNGASQTRQDLFTSLDMNRDGQVERTEWHWSRASFDRLDTNRDGRLSRAEVAASGTAQPAPARTEAYKAGYERGLLEGRAAGREDRERKQGWDLEGQRELEQADSGYTASVGVRADYQAGYRDGFRKGYPEGYGPR